jgi:subfamily B ATP-binding cassette protein MsbA
MTGTASTNRRALVRFVAYVRPYTRLLVLATVCGMAKFVLPSTMALTLKFITDRLVTSAPAAESSRDVIVRSFEAYLGWVTRLLPVAWRSPWGSFNVLIITLVVIYAVWAVALYYRSYLASLAGQRTILDLRTDLYQHLNRLSHSFFNVHQSGAIVSRLMADVALAQNFVGNAMTNIWMDLVTCVFYVYVLFAMDAHLAAAAMLVFPLYVIAMRGFGELTT